MSKFLPIIAGATGTTIIIAGGGYLLSTQNTKTIKELFKEAIIKFDNETELVKEKLAKLKEEKSEPKNAKLKEAKVKEKASEGTGLEDYKKGCKEIYDSNFSSKDTDLFKDFQSFCGRTIKDKLTKESWAQSGAKWKDRFDKLSKEGTKPTSDSLKKIASKTSTNGDELKAWCEKIAEEIFEGNESSEFKDVAASCGKND